MSLLTWEIIVLFLPGERDLAEVPLPAPDVQGSPPAAATALPGSAAHSGRGSPSPSQFRAELREGIPPGDVNFGGKFKFKLQEVHGELLIDFFPVYLPLYDLSQYCPHFCSNIARVMPVPMEINYRITG